MQGVYAASRIGLIVAASSALMFLLFPDALLGSSARPTATSRRSAEQLLRYLAVSGFFITLALTYTGGLQGTGDTRSPLFITLASQIAIPIGLCTVLQAMRPLQPADIWLAIVLGHFTRCVLTFLRFRQGKWRDHRRRSLTGRRLSQASGCGHHASASSA